MFLYLHVIACVFSLYLSPFVRCADIHDSNRSVDHVDDDTAPFDVSQYTVHFTSYASIWNNRDEWHWQSTHNSSIACSKQTPSLCVHAQFSTDDEQHHEHPHHQKNAFQKLKISLRDSSLRGGQIELDFWNDLDWSQVTILHSAAGKNRRRFMYDDDAYGYYDDDDDDDGDDDDDMQAAAAAGEMEADFMDMDDAYYEAADEDADLGAVDTMSAMNAFIFDVDDDVRDIYNMDDYYRYYDRMSAQEWGVFKKIWKGVKKGVSRVARHIGGKLGIYPRPPCSSSARCRVHLYFKSGFHKRANKKGHFCEGKWDRWRLHKYRVFRNRVKSIQVQGSPCCVAMVYNGNKFDGDKQAMFPRGQYRSMHQGLATNMGGMDGMNGMGGGGMMGMMGGGMGMGRHNMVRGFPNKKLASMRVVHDCKLRQNLMQRGMMRQGGGMMGGMHGGGMMGQMMQMMQMMMMMKTMFPSHHKGKHGGMCKSYSCIVHTQQSQLQQLMQMMMMSSMTNQAPITITDNTKKHLRRRRRRQMDLQEEEVSVAALAVQKCKLLSDAEVCVTFDARRQLLTTEYRVADKAVVRPQRSGNGSDVVTRIQSLVQLFAEEMAAFDDEDDDEEDDDDEDGFELDEDDDLLWPQSEVDDDDAGSINMFADLMDMDPHITRQFANRYYDDDVEAIAPVGNDGDADETEDMRRHLHDLETQHAVHLFLGPMTYGLNRNEWLFPEDGHMHTSGEVDELMQSYVTVAADRDVIDYAERFGLQWSEGDDWSMPKMDGHIRCNDRVLAHIAYAVCVDQDAAQKRVSVFFKRVEAEGTTTAAEEGDKKYNVSGYSDFYAKTKHMIAAELDDATLDVLNDAQWTDIYDTRAYNNGARVGSRKVCTYVSMLRVCVESETDTSSFMNDFTLWIEYSAGKESKHAIRENQAIFNEWLKWSDFD